jgi:Trypsin-like serine proteases, typically periplasmic, contain C-terminal PDZ domain
MALAGLVIYAAFAPHSVAVGSIGVAVAGIGWILRTVATRSFGVSRTKFDLIIILSLLWTAISSLVSVEPSISLLKLQASWCVFIFYLTRAITTKKTVLGLAAIMILSASVGSLYSVYDLVRGRGVVIETISNHSPFQQIQLKPGDTIWRIEGHRIYSLAEIDDLLRTMAPGTKLSVDIISHGEHVERPGLIVPSSFAAGSISGITGSLRNHRFRASGWTRHYETFAELLQIIAQLALGLSLAHLRNHGTNKFFKVAVIATALITVGITLTAMRTVIIAFMCGATLIAWLSLRGVLKIAFTFALFFLLAFAAVVVSETRADQALSLSDPSSELRLQIAEVGIKRLTIHPVFGHGMDAMKRHWNEWGFPGHDILHLHSTPLQLAFDRGIPMVVLWVWLMGSFWILIFRAQGHARDLSDTHAYGFLLGALGALSGFLLSSLVNYNYGDAEVAMLFWWLMGASMVMAGESREME